VPLNAESCDFGLAVCLIVLAVRSCVYRIHCAIWNATTVAIACNKEFTGLLDQFQIVAFCVLYVLIADILPQWLDPRRRAKPA